MQKLSEFSEEEFQQLGKEWLKENLKRYPVATEDDFWGINAQAFYDMCPCHQQCPCTLTVCNECCECLGCRADKECEKCEGIGSYPDKECKTCKGFGHFFLPDVEDENLSKSWDDCSENERKFLEEARIYTHYPRRLDEETLLFLSKTLSQVGINVFKNPLDEESLCLSLPRFPNKEDTKHE